MRPINSDSHTVVLFDGVCNLCSSAVQFIIRRDPKGAFRFAALQSSVGRRLLADHGLAGAPISTIILIEDGRCYTRSAATLRIARRLKGLWPLAYGAIVIPAPLRNMVYTWIARNRYRWFGHTEHCMLPTAELRARFLD